MGYFFVYEGRTDPSKQMRAITPPPSADQSLPQNPRSIQGTRSLQSYFPVTRQTKTSQEPQAKEPETLILPVLGHRLKLFETPNRLYTGTWKSASPPQPEVVGRILKDEGYASVRFYTEGFIASPTAEIILINQGRYLDSNSMTLWLNMNFSQLSGDGSQLMLRIPPDVEYTTSGMTTQEYWLATDFSYYDVWLTLRFHNADGSPYNLLKPLNGDAPAKVQLEVESVWLQRMRITANSNLRPDMLEEYSLQSPEKGWQRYLPLSPLAALMLLGAYSALGGISAKIFSENIRVSPYWGKIGMLPAAIASINLVHYYYMLLYISSAYIGLRFWTILLLAVLSQGGASAIVVFITLGIFQGQTGMQHLSFPTKFGVILYFTAMFVTVLFTRQIANSTTIHTWYLIATQTGAPLQLIRYLLNRRSSVAQPVNPIQEFRWEYNICYFTWVSVTAYLLRGSDNDVFLLSFKKSAGVAILALNFLPMFLMLLLAKCGTRLATIFRINRGGRNATSLPNTASNNPGPEPIELVEVNRNLEPLNDGRN